AKILRVTAAYRPFHLDDIADLQSRKREDELLVRVVGLKVGARIAQVHVPRLDGDGVPARLVDASLVQRQLLESGGVADLSQFAEFLNDLARVEARHLMDDRLDSAIGLDEAGCGGVEDACRGVIEELARHLPPGAGIIAEGSRLPRGTARDGVCRGGRWSE